MAEIEPPYLTTFEWPEPAQSVSLAGTFTKWKEVPLKKGKENKWRKVFHLRPGRHQYHFIVDGERKLLPIKTVNSRNPNTPGERENVRRIRHQPALIGERADKEEVGAHNPTYWRDEEEEEEGETEEEGEYEEEHEAEHEDVAEEEEEEDEVHESDREAMHALVEEERQRQIEDESKIPEEIHESNREDLQKQAEEERQRLMEQEDEIVSEIREKAMECERKKEKEKEKDKEKEEKGKDKDKDKEKEKEKEKEKDKEKEKESSKSQPQAGQESDQSGVEHSADEEKIIDVHEDDEAKSKAKARTPPPPSPSLKPEINEDIDILDAALQSDGEETIKVRPRLQSDHGSAMHQGTLEPTLEVEPPTAKNILESLSLAELERKKRQLSKRIGFFGGLGLGKVLGFGLLVGAAVAAVYFIAKPSRRERSSNQ